MFDMIPFRRNNNITRRGDYFDELMDNFFTDNFPTSFMGMGNSFTVDVKENENNYEIAADLPGIKKEAIDISYDNNYLTISAKKDDAYEDKRDNYVRRERRCGEFRRSFYIDNIDENSIDATFKDGVLNIVVPKNPNKKDNRKRIDIH